MNVLLVPALFALVGCTSAISQTPSTPVAASGEKSIYDFTMNDIDGKAVKLDSFKGKVLMVVNVASKCGNTPQYATLESLYKKYKDKGLVILGFPANQFMAQEPGTNAEIKEFCTATYGVSFPMFSKIVVKGDEINPLYQWLIANSDRPNDAIEWNFAKFIIGRDGKEVARIAPKTKPDDPAVVEAIEKALNS